MDIEKLKILRAHIASLSPERCDMSQYAGTAADDSMPPAALHTCGTAGCLAGYAVALFGTDEQRQNDRYSFHERTFPDDIAAGILDLYGDKPNDLFQMSSTRHRFEDASKASMVRVLDILIETGQVDWDRAIEETADGE